ncbi:MAG: nitroreductase family protein [Bacteroidales bacterium]|nr:nitroreductase family protein [Bacteroidales bacterium]
MKKNILNENIINRKSILSFSDKPVSDENIKLLFEAARWAPSSYNAQPWRFVVTRKAKDKLYDHFYSILAEGNKTWAATAPILVLSAAEVLDTKNRPNRFAFHDLGMAVGNLLVQATSMELFAHQMGGYDVNAARKLLNMPDNFEPGAMIAIGYKGDPNILPDDLIIREQNPRIRKKIDEFVFAGKWEL